MVKKNETKKRILGRVLAKEISAEELKKAFGGVELDGSGGTTSTTCSCDTHDDCDV
jgi:hypothetical protein